MTIRHAWNFTSTLVGIDGTVLMKSISTVSEARRVGVDVDVDLVRVGKEGTANVTTFRTRRFWMSIFWVLRKTFAISPLSSVEMIPIFSNRS